MYCSIISATEKWTLWGIKSRKNLDETLKDKFNALFDVAAVGDNILLETLDGFAYLKITELNNSDRSVSVIVESFEENKEKN